MVTKKAKFDLWQSGSRPQRGRVWLLFQLLCRLSILCLGQIHNIPRISGNTILAHVVHWALDLCGSRSTIISNRMKNNRHLMPLWILNKSHHYLHHQRIAVAIIAVKIRRASVSAHVPYISLSLFTFRTYQRNQTAQEFSFSTGVLHADRGQSRLEYLSDCTDMKRAGSRYSGCTSNGLHILWSVLSKWNFAIYSEDMFVDENGIWSSNAANSMRIVLRQHIATAPTPLLNSYELIW